MKIRQLLVDARDCAGPLDDAEHLMALLHAAAAAVGATVVGSTEVRFVPHGVTAVLVLAESHIVVSTWPEHRLALVDLLLCNEGMDPRDAWAALEAGLRPGEAELVEVGRFVG